MQILISSLDEIRLAARQFINSIGDNRIFAFYGSMGAGKTTFIKAICQELGVTDDVASPTFAIVNEYETGILNAPLSALSQKPVFHFDFYRIKRETEAYDMGFEDYVYSGNLCFMEWPELIENLLPEETVRVTITEQPDGTRLVSLTINL